MDTILNIPEDNHIRNILMLRRPKLRIWVKSNVKTPRCTLPTFLYPLTCKIRIITSSAEQPPIWSSFWPPVSSVSVSSHAVTDFFTVAVIDSVTVFVTVSRRCQLRIIIFFKYEFIYFLKLNSNWLKGENNEIWICLGFLFF